MLASESSINETHLHQAAEACRPRRRILVLARAAAVLLAFAVCLPVSAQSSLRYYGGMATNQVDRVKIRIDPPGPPVDVGSTTDFTVELFLRTAPGNNRSLPGCGAGTYSWIEGNIFLDRNRYGLGRDYGLALGGGRVMFGIRGTNGEQVTICGTRNVADGQWHHIAVQRQRSDGHMWLYVDGQLELQADGPDGDISYPDNGPVGTGCGGPCTQSDPFLVIGTEKHDQAFGFSGLIDELRVSTQLRYSTNFAPTTAPFAPDAMTAALYHFDEGSADVIVDATPGSLSPGARFLGQGGGAQPGPTWETDSPFGGTPSPGTVQFQSATATVGEGAGTANITVTRSGGTAGAASVRYLITGGTATSGSDFTPLAADTLNWADGDGAAKPISISLINDAAVEAAETINLQLSNATGATLGAPTTTTLTINDNDAPPAPGSIEFQAASFAAGEAAGTAVITVTRANGSAGAASVQFQITGGTATAASDYTAPAANTLNWADGDGAAKTVSIGLINDTEVEGAETIILQLSNATGATLGSTTTTTVTITDNDASPPPPGGGGGGGGGGGFDWLALCVLLGSLARALSGARMENRAA